MSFAPEKDRALPSIVPTFFITNKSQPIEVGIICDYACKGG
jgi:hypothetical protein